MSEQWMGLHNPERHGPLQQSIAGAFRHCSCGLNCMESNPCLCCLAAEVEALRAQIKAVRDLCDEREKAGAQFLAPDTLTVAEVRAAMGGRSGEDV